MSAKDMVREALFSSYKNLTGGGISLPNILLIFVMAAIMGVYIFMIYRLLSKDAFYSRDLNMTIAGIVLIVAAIMIAMQSNLIVSLGMVGALSIVRFRNAVKNPLDLLFLFWAVGVGILCGVEMVLLAVITSAAMTALLLVLQLLPGTKAAAVLVLRSGDLDLDWEKVNEIVKGSSKYCKEKSHNITRGETEVIYELKCGNEEDLMNELKSIEGLDKICYLKHDGELRV